MNLLLISTNNGRLTSSIKLFKEGASLNPLPFDTVGGPGRQIGPGCPRFRGATGRPMPTCALCARYTRLRVLADGKKVYSLESTRSRVILLCLTPAKHHFRAKDQQTIFESPKVGDNDHTKNTIHRGGDEPQFSSSSSSSRSPPAKS